MTCCDWKLLLAIFVTGMVVRGIFYFIGRHLDKKIGKLKGKVKELTESNNKLSAAALEEAHYTLDGAKAAQEEATAAYIDNVCLSKQHDFGLMAEGAKDRMRNQCKDWLRAIRNNNSGE